MRDIRKEQERISYTSYFKRLMYLAGDIGGTKTHLGLFQQQGNSLKLISEERYSSKDHKSLKEIVVQFLSVHEGLLEGACFGIAGPIDNRRCKATNLPWIVDTNELEATTKTKVTLINDLEANAYGISTLVPTDLLCLHKGEEGAKGNTAVVSPGTGLGEAGLYWDGKIHHPIACEGGHADFAPQNELQVELWRYLRNKLPHVSYESTLSGQGLHNIYCFLRDTKKGKEEPWLTEELKMGNLPATISKAGLSGKSPLCAQALDIFVSICGAATGNLALKFLARGGVYIGGGIAPKIIEKFKDPPFLDAFFDKGRLRSLLKKIPVYVILNSKTALFGAAQCAKLHFGKN